MSENRKNFRTSIGSYISVNEQNNMANAGFLKDISSKGLRIKSTKSYIPRRSYKLVVSLPDSDNSLKKVAVDTEVIWSKESDIAGYYETGFEFSELNNNFEQIEQFIENSGNLAQFIFPN